jgi:hypothetical protein
MHPTHATAAGIFAELHHKELIAEAEQVRLTLQAQAGPTETAGAFARVHHALRAMVRLGNRPRRLPATSA